MNQERVSDHLLEMVRSDDLVAVVVSLTHPIERDGHY
jgi:hypothetical protein